MIDPKRCVIERNPIITPGGRIEYIATMTFHVRESIQVELEQRDLTTEGALDPRIRERLQKLVWKAVYGDLLAPVAQLLALAQKCPPNFKNAADKNAAVLLALLRMKTKQPDEPSGSNPGPGSSG